MEFGMKAEKILIVAGIGLAAYFIFFRKDGTNKRQWLIDFLNTTSDSEQAKAGMRTVFMQMSDSEIDATFDFFKNYLSKGIQPPAALREKINQISIKYNIFT